MKVIDEMVNRFLSWPLPESVCADLIVTKQGPGRIGTNLLTANEAKQMLEHVLAAPSPAGPDALAEELERMSKLPGIPEGNEWTSADERFGRALRVRLVEFMTALRSCPAQGDSRDAELDEKTVEVCAKVCEAQIGKDENRGRLQSRSILTRCASIIRDLVKAPARHKCTPGDILRGYQGSYDIAWCKVCGTITWGSDGLIPDGFARLREHSEWKTANVVAWSCTAESEGRDKCKEWCGNQGYCTAATKLWPAIDAAMSQQEPQTGGES